ncbi:MAG: hypothetical protein DRJ15_13150 [Bacteroidetes bacterium]|nr:MAG: hypothetical protein DRJ15_13150 [Bacteroidota bacterium]
MQYLPVNVLKHGDYDCSNNGITVTHSKKLVVPCEGGHITEEDIEKRGYIVLQLGTMGRSMHFRQAGPKNHSMFGGNFVHSGDSRFGKAYGRQPIHVHDRIEG